MTPLDDPLWYRPIGAAWRATQHARRWSGDIFATTRIDWHLP